MFFFNNLNFVLFTEIEGHPTTNLKNLPWSPLYCVLQQDEQTFTAYCSEELSVCDIEQNLLFNSIIPNKFTNQI